MKMHVSGQLVNRPSKSCLLIRPKPSANLQSRVSNITGFVHKDLPVKYLGCPIYHGRKKKWLFAELIDNISNKIRGWSKKWLSHGVRITLLQSVLYSLAVHFLGVMHPPKGVVHDLKRCLQIFYGKM